MEAALSTSVGRMPLGSGIVKIGSAPDNQLVLNDPKASPLHAGIRPEAQGYSLTDLGSASGTFVNGQRLDYNVPRLLNAGDAIRIGDTIFTYEVSGVSTPLVGANLPGSPGQLNSGEVPPTVAAPVPQYGSYNAGSTGTQQAYQPAPVASGPAAQPAATPQANPYAAYSASLPGQAAPVGVPDYLAPPADPFAALASPGSPASPSEFTLASLRQREHRRDLWMALGILAAVLIIGFIVFQNTHSPQRTLDTYCSALLSGNYQTAYNQLSPGGQAALSESNFVLFYFSDRKVVSCSYTNVNVSGNSATATVTTTTDSSGSNSSQVVYVLVQDSSFNWRIDDIKNQNQ